MISRGTLGLERQPIRQRTTSGNTYFFLMFVRAFIGCLQDSIHRLSQEKKNLEMDASGQEQGNLEMDASICGGAMLTCEHPEAGVAVEKLSCRRDDFVIPTTGESF